MSKIFDHKAKRADHMARRRAHGLTYKDLGDSFGTAKSTAHSIVNKGDKMPKSKKPSAAAKEKVKSVDAKLDPTEKVIKPKKQKKKDVMREGFNSYGSAS